MWLKQWLRKILGREGRESKQGELWAIKVKVASRNRLGVVICFGQRAFITYNFFRRFFVCFVLFYFLTFLITCEFKHACILGLFLLPSGKSFFFPFSFFLSFLVSFPVSFVLKFVFPFLVGSYRGLQQFVNKKLFAAVYFTTKSKSAQNIFLSSYPIVAYNTCCARLFKFLRQISVISSQSC